MTRKLITLLLILLAFPIIGSAQQPLRVGTDFFYPPYVISGNPDYTGFDVDFMREVCKLINRKCVFVPMEFTTLFTAINQGKIDVAIDAITISPTRQKQYLFSYPYMLSFGGILVRTNSLLETENDLIGKKIGVISGTLFRHILFSKYGNKVTIKDFVRVDNLLDALKEGRVDAIFLDVSAANYWRINSGHKFRRIGNTFKMGFGLGIMTKLNNHQLINEINRAIVIIENDGMFTELFDRYLSLSDASQLLHSPSNILHVLATLLPRHDILPWPITASLHGRLLAPSLFLSEQQLARK